ncbi:MAG: alpha-1,4-glucan--maltose-1-phosphate maltosyltransferase [Geminicoccaceae bacterium]|nr:MAG: alpha-1,4-glucan--maltose-1-phosphate maltosyltransferase [Geminicoccaceae bacterium]
MTANQAGRPALRCYEIDTRLAPAPDDWSGHLRRIVKMGFDAVIVPDQPAMADQAACGAFLAAAKAAGLHAFSSLPAGDLGTVAERGEAWLARGGTGCLVRSAQRIDPADWRAVLQVWRGREPGVYVVAEALGAAVDVLQGLATAGFDAVFDSSFWWNGHDRWFLDQEPVLRSIGHPIALTEDIGGERLIDRLHGEAAEAIERRYRAVYVRAVGLSDGLVMRMGFEYGAASWAGDWTALTQSAPFDLTRFITAANRVKAGHAALGSGARLRRVSAPNARIAAFLRFDSGSPARAQEAAFVVLNPDPSQSDGLAVPGLVTAAGGRFEAITDITPEAPPLTFRPDAPLTLEPLAVRLFASPAAALHKKRPPSARASEKRLLELAASRVAIERVSPELDGGRFPIKRVVGDVLEVEADILMDGHDKLAAALLYKAADEADWHRVPMHFVDNDRWAGRIPLTRNCRYRYTVEAWFDVFATWRLEVSKKHGAGVPIALELEEGRQLVARTAARAEGEAKAALEALLAELQARVDDEGFQLARFLAADTEALMQAADLKVNRTVFERELEVIVDRTIAAVAAWYELFPRSMSDDPMRHGTFDDVIEKLPYVRDMGFDVLYFPPIHPIGQKNRKGRNNSLTAQPGDPGSPYAIGSHEGGHDALHSELGSFEDFERLVEAAHAHGLEIAIDFAIQCSPDHPWIEQHPDWFDWRPDGSLRYAENPPKKYEDISNVAFYREGALPSLWQALRDVVLFWVKHGVKIFRVDNPHTKPLPFWEWLIHEVQLQHPDTVFLSEAFTRPKMMKRLAKLGFTQSYSYFTWRNTKAELQDYLIELTQDEPKEHMRPNFFVNTPDINPVYLQTSGRAGFQVRAVLASTLSTLWGVYSGFELTEGRPLPGKEEYLDSEKYEIKAWDWNRIGHIREDIRLLNTIRRENPAFWSFTNLTFHEAWNDQVMVYSKITPSLDNAVLIAVNLDPHVAQGCQFEVPLWQFGLHDDASIDVEDLVTGARFTWHGKVQHLWLDPRERPYAIWRLVPPGLVAAAPASQPD